jgi:hypothetical protein
MLLVLEFEFGWAAGPSAKRRAIPAQEVNSAAGDVT